MLCILHRIKPCCSKFMLDKDKLDNCREEKAANVALKKQLLCHMDTPRLDTLRITTRNLAPVAEMVFDLIEAQENPPGERYSLLKVLETNQQDLRSCFLHYCQLDKCFSDHWPPCLTADGWEEFYKDAGISGQFWPAFLQATPCMQNTVIPGIVALPGPPLA